MAVSRKQRFQDNSYYRGAFRWMGIGFEFCLVVGAFCLLGHFLDKLEDTSPGWLIMGFFAGFGVMMYMMVKRSQKENDQPNTDDEQDTPTSGQG